MNATRLQLLPSNLRVAYTLAQLLERLEHSEVPVGPEQYLSVVRHLTEELGKVETDASLQALLDTHPATAELYENINYQHAGLCRSPLEVSMSSELQAKETIARAAGSIGFSREKPAG